MSGHLYSLIYTLPLGHFFKKHGLKYYFYANNNQDYISFKVKDLDENVTKVLACLKDIRKWLLPNMLHNNGVKTELSVHGTTKQLSKIKDISLDIEGVTISPKQAPDQCSLHFDLE